ncbi:hypothetical protein [Nonomuraea turkmeniaca]|nr:hypothetical protein [Nonomuraea turkmeniaca]
MIVLVLVLVLGIQAGYDSGQIREILSIVIVALIALSAGRVLQGERLQ